MSVKFQDQQVVQQHPQHQQHPKASVESDADKRDKESEAAGDVRLGPPKNVFEAAERGMVGYIVKAVERTLEFNINQRDRLQRTALHWAAECGHVHVVEALMDYGCDQRLTECNGRTPIHLASRGLHVAVLKVLLEGTTPHEMECMVNQTDNFGITPVFMTLQRGEEGRPCFEFLMDCGARYNTLSMPKLSPEDQERIKARLQLTEDPGNEKN